MKRTQKLFVYLSSLLGLGIWEAVPAHAVRDGIPKSIRRFERVPRHKRAEVQGQGPRDRSMSFYALGRRFDLELEPSNLTSRGIRNTVVNGSSSSEAGANIEILKGKLRGQPQSWVRLSIINGSIDGIVSTPGEMYFIQPSTEFDAEAPAGESVVYRLSDASVDLGPESCGVEHDAAGEPTGLEVLGGGGEVPLAEEAGSTMRETEIGLVADKAFYDRHPGDAAEQMLSLMNQISGIYEAQLGISFRVTQTVVFTSPDPFSSSTDPGTLLDSFGAYRNSPTSPVFGTDLAHLFTGRDLDGSTVGLAWIGTVCSSLNGAGLSQDFSTNNTLRVVLTAHEIGHNFNARHDDNVGSVCVGPSSTPFIMQSFVSSDSLKQFSSNPSCSPVCCSKEVMTTFAQGRSCLADVVVGTPTQIVVPTQTRTPTLTWTSVPTMTRTPTRTSTTVVTQAPVSTATPSYTHTPTRTFTPTFTMTSPPSVPTATRTATPRKTRRIKPRGARASML